MQTVPITSIELESNGCLLVRPGPTDPATTSTLRFIYRDATGIEWRESDGAFYPYRVETASPLEWFRIILAAARNELGLELQVTPGTNWIQVPSDVRKALMGAVADATSNMALERSRDG